MGMAVSGSDTSSSLLVVETMFVMLRPAVSHGVVWCVTVRVGLWGRQVIQWYQRRRLPIEVSCEVRLSNGTRTQHQPPLYYIHSKNTVQL